MPNPAQRTIPYPGHMPVPTMLTRSEIDYLHHLAAHEYTAAGRIIDLGCFLGGSTMPLAAGLAANPRATADTILTYDAFIMDPHSAATFPVGCAQGESFRPIFESYLRDHLPRITIREGYIPTETSPAIERTLYPEQQPVEILFIDIAKAWLVHNTILTTFGRHLIPGRSIVVQQDFKHFGVYWIALHMLQLAPCFTLLHDIEDASTVSFLYTGGIEHHLPALWKPADIPASQINEVWDRVDAHWSAHPGILPFLRLRRATHLLHAGCAHEGIDALERAADDIPRTADPRTRHELALAIDWARRKSGPRTTDESARLTALAQRPATSASASIPTPAAARAQRRLDILALCEAKNYRTVALFGAGRHTAELLSSGWPHGRLNIAAIIDDFSLAPAVNNIPVLRPAAIPTTIDAIILSSDTSEPALRAAATKSLANLPILPIYNPAP